MINAACSDPWARTLRVAIAAVVALLFARGAHADIEVERPRPFGYVVGDELEVVVRAAPGDGEPDASSVPKLGRVARDLALRSVAMDGQALRLRYQIIGAPESVATIEVPGWTLALRTAAGATQQRVESFSITVSPLTPAEPVARDGLEAVRPAIEPLRADITGARARLGAYGAIGLVLSLVYAWSAWGMAWFAPRRAPFARATFDLARLESSDPQAGMRALRIAHRAVDTRAGRVVMEPDLDAFFAAHPQLGSMRADVTELFRRSGAAFFAAAPPPADTLAFVRDLCRRAAHVDRR